MSNNFDIRDTIKRYQWFYRTVNVHSHHQKEVYKGDEKQWKVTQT